MKRKLLSLLVLLIMTTTSAWAAELYFVVDAVNKSATMMYDDNNGNNPTYNQYSVWYCDENIFYETHGFYFGGFMGNTCKTITIDASCRNYTGTNFKSLLSGWRQVTTINNLENLNTSNATTMDGMFEVCQSLTTLDLSSFNTSNVKDMSSMFSGCSQLKAIFVGNAWSAGDHVTYNNYMFYNCTNLPNWDGTVDKTHANTGTDGYLNKIKVTAHEGATGEYWTTFYNENKSFIAPTGTQVFKVELDNTNLKLTMHEVVDKTVNAYLPVVLKSTGENIVMTVSASTAGDGNPNSLSGIAVPEGLTADDPSTTYVLNNGSHGVGFYKLKSGKKLSAGKAYLNYSGGAGAREFFSLEDEATGIDATLVNSDKVNEVVYDLLGRDVAQPTKGLYIVNGKKVFINK